MEIQEQTKVLKQAVQEADRILFVTGAGLSAESGLPTYRGLTGLYNGLTEDGISIEEAISGEMLLQNPALCWRYLAQVGKACLENKPNAGHEAIAKIQLKKPGCWILTQNIDGYHFTDPRVTDRVIEIHGSMSPLFCMDCKKKDLNDIRSVLGGDIPPRCECGGVMRPPVVLYGEMLGEKETRMLTSQLDEGFDIVIYVGTSALFPYIQYPMRKVMQEGGVSFLIDPDNSLLSPYVTMHLKGNASEILPSVV